MSDDTPTRGVKVATLQENFALRDEIKQLRILIAGIIRSQGGRMSVSNRSLQSISHSDTFTTEDDYINDGIILTFEGKP